MNDLKNISLKDLAAHISDYLRKCNIDVILVGGACVSIHSHNRYQSYDLDFVTYAEMKKVKASLEKIGFQDEGKYFKHHECPYLIEFVTPPAAVGSETIDTFDHIDTPLGTIKMLRPEDSIKDRLASYFHWSDRESLNQAIDIYIETNPNLDEIYNWAKKENHLKKYNEFLTKIDLLE